MGTVRTRSDEHFRLDPAKIKRAQRLLRAGATLQCLTHGGEELGLPGAELTCESGLNGR